MAWMLFVDESGQDHVNSPYEVLAGIAIQDRVLWKLICEIQDLELAVFGTRYSDGARELKGSKILKKKVFQHADLNVAVEDDDVAGLASSALLDGANAGVANLKALALAKIKYVQGVFELCNKYSCKAFASIVDPEAENTSSEGLRKDYGYLFERFFYFVDDSKYDERGLIVFDELEKSASHILNGQVQKYFKETAIGKFRSGKIVPEPLFVHSDLTTGIQIADLIAYSISWGIRFGDMSRPKRDELKPITDLVMNLRYLSKKRHIAGDPNFQVWSFAAISDLRTQSEKSP